MCGITRSAGILGIGFSVPEKVLSNSDLEKMVDTSDEWITKRTGISERRILEKGVPTYTLGVEASKKALENASLSPEEIDLIIVATDTPDYLTPSTSSIIQSKLGARNAATFDLNAACTGFMYAMTVAEQFIKVGYYKHVLVVGCEGLTKVVNFEDRNTCVLFGDGSGAAVLGEVEHGYGILNSYLGSNGDLGMNITIPCLYQSEEDIKNRSGNENKAIWLDGGEVFKFAVKAMEGSTIKVLDDIGLSLDDVCLIVPHQANIRIIDGAVKRLDISEDKIFTNVKKYGNMSSASIPIALCEAVEQGRIKKGDNIVLVGFGGGLTWGSLVIKWSK